MFTDPYSSLIQAGYRQQELLREAANNRLVDELRAGSSALERKGVQRSWRRTISAFVALLRGPTRDELCCSAGPVA